VPWRPPQSLQEHGCLGGCILLPGTDQAVKSAELLAIAAEKPDAGLIARGEIEAVRS